MQIPGNLLGPALDSLTLNVAILDSDATILASNRAWQEFGRANDIRPPADTVGDNYIDICAGADDEYARTAIAGLREILGEERESFSFEYPCHSPEVKRWFLMHASRFETRGNDYLVVAHENITQRKVAELKAEQRTEELQEFARLLSHDLRNPLAVAQGSAKMLAMDTDDDYLDDILSSLLRMEAIIDDALTLMQYGTEGRDKEPVRLSNLTESAWSNVETESVKLTRTDDRILDGYPDLLAHVFENLFRNAIEHGEAETITVGATKNGFHVEDDGTGIPAEMRGKVFEMGHTTQKNGTGFGLAIVESLIDSHGWSISVAGSETGGARFEIRTNPAVPKNRFGR
ncbi:His Kinase A (phospho-acceptor) domain-containing protein [Haladaptatus litoreus]|uniref:histidine kinase n=1 Tax=Haladaptatus litoreus TaxID=553468 RepID=A0A1N6W174_9EURY|nr:PAS domain-containing sensor histidine kinase [Haladaptatus litoreus]SIQ83869.1 His Kinase A (phospho-acceptor) domain-containing protein [Haladaptatus litoreus]